jgi:hypothetical protein
VAYLAFAGLWFWFLSRAQSEVQWLSSPNDWIIRLIQFVGLVAVLGTIAPVANVGAVFADPARGWWAKVSSVSIALACLAAIWFVISLKLITLQIAY